ncbi:MAG: zinc-dependent peptidase [Bacteroidota bacterium]
MWIFYLIPIILLAGLIVHFYVLLKDGFSLFVKSTGIQARAYTGRAGYEVDQVLRKNNFYSELSLGGKKRFLFRTVNFMFDKEFVGMNGFTVTEEMKLLISASAVQLTWGLEEYKLHHYHTIRVFPDTFYSKMMNSYLKGGATKNGVVFLSWKDFVAGYATPDDKYNLGLHEMAHALKLDVLYGDYADDHMAENLESWLETAYPEFERIRSGQTSFLRDYAGTNMHEFFAVSVEHFFEVPAQFKEALPKLYEHLCYILRIDPLNKAGDFLYNRVPVIEKKPIYTKIAEEYKEEKEKFGFAREIIYAITGIGVFVYFFVLPLIMSVTFLPDYMIWVFIFVFGSLNFIKYKKYRELVVLNDISFVAFSYIGVGIIATTLFYTINYSVHIGNLNPESHAIESSEYTYYKSKRGGNFDNKTEFTYSNNALGEYRQARTFYHIDYTFLKPGDTIEYHISTGILGLPVIHETKIKR